MINTTKDIMIIKQDSELTQACVSAISRAKECVRNTMYQGRTIFPEDVSVNKHKGLTGASIIRLFYRHDDPKSQDLYDESWIERIFKCAQKVPTDDFARSVVTPFELSQNWIGRTSCKRLKSDATLILHFLWSEGAVLLPMNQKLPTTQIPGTRTPHFEYAAEYYPEVLALVRKPFCPDLEAKEQVPDITKSKRMPPTSIDNFGWYAWRLIRACTWYRIEDVNTEDAAKFWDKYSESRYEFRYPVAPHLILACIHDLFENRVTYTHEECLLSSLKGHGSLTPSVNERNIASGTLYIPPELMSRMEPWLSFGDRFLKATRARGVTNLRIQKQALSKLNKYLITEVGKSGIGGIPHPKELSRKYIEGFDGLPSLLDYVRDGISDTVYKNLLYRLDDFFNYVESYANAGDEAEGFRNPMASIDFPIVTRPRGSTKKEFKSEHFGPLVEFLYALEAFGFYLCEVIYKQDFNEFIEEELLFTRRKLVSKIFKTDKLGFIPIVYSDNPDFDETKEASTENKKSIVTPIYRIHQSLIPLLPRYLKGHHGYTLFPNIIPIQHTITALETGIRNIHIRYLDRNEYDKNIDRSMPIPPVCDLYVSTDKTHGGWDSKVSENVIRLLDRQASMHDWFDEPGMLDPVWYNEVEDSPFGKISTLFPRGLAASVQHGVLPGPFTATVLSRHFKLQVFSFDLFCRYSLRCEASNPMPRHFASIDSLDSDEAFINAFEHFEDAKELIGHTPHSCRVSVISEWIKIIPPELIGRHKTGHTSAQQVIYYAKVSRSYLKDREEYQKLAVEYGADWDETNIAGIKAEEANSKLQKAIRSNRNDAMSDFGATSFERETSTGEVLAGVRIIKTQPLDQVSFQGTHICPFGMNCPQEIVRDLKAIPGKRMPCGSCYYSVKTIDNLPRILGKIRSLTDECSAIKEYISEVKANGASPESFTEKAAYRDYLASEIVAWSVTAHCLQQMYESKKDSDDFLVEKPEIVAQRLECLKIEDTSLQSLLARMNEAKTFPEFFTPTLEAQLKKARKRILAKTNDIQSLLEDSPTGFNLIDECRGLIKNTCDLMGISVVELANELDKPLRTERGSPLEALELIFGAGGTGDA